MLGAESFFLGKTIHFCNFQGARNTWIDNIPTWKTENNFFVSKYLEKNGKTLYNNRM